MLKMVDDDLAVETVVDLDHEQQGSTECDPENSEAVKNMPDGGTSKSEIDAVSQPIGDDFQTVGSPMVDNAKISVRDVSVYYSDKQAVFGVNFDIAENEVVAMIGPSGCGKSTFLRCINRMNDTIDGCRVTGSIDWPQDTRLGNASS